MKIYDYSNIEKIFFVGDIHGEFQTLFNTIKNKIRYSEKDEKEYEDESVHPLIQKENEKLYGIDGNADYEDEEPTYLSRMKKDYFNKKKDTYNNSVIIVAGDCGFGFNSFQYYLDKFKKINVLMGKTNTNLLFVRGNHDNPKYFSDEMLNMENIKCIPDYSLVLTKNHKTLCVGGAISIDRMWRKQEERRINKYKRNGKRELYWSDEICIFDENKLKEIEDSGIKIDSVVTHSCPSFCMPNDKNGLKTWIRIDKDIQNDVNLERETLTKLYEYLKDKYEIGVWVYGHFHSVYSYFSHGIFFICLDDNYVITDAFLIKNQIGDKHLYNDKLHNNEFKRVAFEVQPNGEVIGVLE